MLRTNKKSLGKMAAHLGLGLFLVGGVAALSSTGLSETYQIDTSKSSLDWEGSKVVGSKHNGKVKVKSGTIEFTNTTPKAATILVAMDTISNADLEGKWNAKLVGHLKSEDFFHVSKYPTSKIVAKKFEALGGGKYKVTGDLTILSVTKPLTFTATASGTNVTADIKFDRTDWSLKYGSGKFFKDLGDKMISDEVSIKVNLVTKKALKLGQK